MSNSSGTLREISGSIVLRSFVAFLPSLNAPPSRTTGFTSYTKNKCFTFFIYILQFKAQNQFILNLRRWSLAFAPLLNFLRFYFVCWWNQFKQKKKSLIFLEFRIHVILYVIFIWNGKFFKFYSFISVGNRDRRLP